MRIAPTLCTLLTLILSFSLAHAQMAPWHQKTLLPDSLIDCFIDEASGEITMQHVVEMSGYNRNRPANEYHENYLEADYVLGKLREYEFDTAEIEYFEADSMWDGEVGELWEVSPRHRKLADYDNMTAVLAKGSCSTDTTAELIYVGRGSSEDDYEGVDVSGKIVLGYGSTSSMHYAAVINRGAVGVISFASIHPLEDPDQVPWFSIWGDRKKRSFAFNLGLRRGMALRDRLERGENIVVRAVVKSSYQPNRHNVVTATIRGRDLPEESIIFSAHLFEGIAKQGADDNISGSAALLEIGRTILQLMRDGKIERPRRTIRLLWIPEFSGTIPWVEAHQDLIEKTLVNINLDMVGVHLANSHSRFNLERTPFSRPSYLNDVVESLMEYVSQTNWETLHNRSFDNPIVAPTGSRDPFLCSIDYHYGASDHVVFNEWGVKVPGVMLITWPDMWYHSSGDRPDKIDPTQLKRAVFVSAVSAYVMARADDEIVLRLGAEIYSNGLGRIGREYQRAAEMVNYADPSDLTTTHKRARGVVLQAADQENRTLLSLLELVSHDSKLRDHLKKLAQDMKSDMGPRMDDKLRTHYRMVCKLRGVPAAESSLTSEEKEARKVMPKPTAKVRGWFRREWIADTVERTVQDSLTTISGRKTRELRTLIDGTRNALEITTALDAEFEEPTEAKDVMNYLRLLEKAGLITM